MATTEEEKAAFHVAHEFLRPVSRREAYHADITYGTNSEFGFDYLRDNLEYVAERFAPARTQLRHCRRNRFDFDR